MVRDPPACATSSNRSGASAALRASRALERLIDVIGSVSAWLIVPLVLVTVFDVTARKLVWIQIWLVDHVSPIFESTLLQELEWHLHTALFALVLGYGSIYNAHVRIDLIREKLAFRTKAWLEFLGLTLFTIPFCTVLIYFGAVYAYDSWAISEISASQVGLTHRWIIKSVLVLGLVLAALASIAVWLQAVLVLWGPSDLRFPLMTLDWPDEAGSRIEGKERIVLEDGENVPAAQARRGD